MAYLKHYFAKLTLYCFMLITGVALTACNGSSSTNTSPDVANNVNTIVVVDTNLLTEQSIELILFYPDSQLSNINWQQTAGEQISILTTNTKIISFTPSQPGSYSFTVTFSVNNGASQSLTKTLNIDNISNKIATRLAHTVQSGNNVSLRTSINSSIIPNTLQWEQTAGPQITFTEANSQGDLAVFFDAPTVTKDTLMSFKVSASDGVETYIDHVAVLVEPAPIISNNAYFDTQIAKVFPYNQNSPYTDSLVGCVYSNTLSSSCTLARLPLLAKEGNELTVGNIMNRVVVSHSWMGERFKDFLLNYDNYNDFKRLLRATTAIVISYDIRPSFYWAATGAIYLDAENFWITPQERDTINEAPDYRANFGNELQFAMPWRYVKDNTYATPSFSKAQRITRTSNDGFYRLASLLYHELAHANDFFPSTEWFTHEEKTRILDAATSTDFESDQLSVALPLQSRVMRDLAQVSFAGERANASQQAYLPNDIKNIFSLDSATDYYAYSSLREDYAMLFEELMMQSRFQVFRDVAITNQPIGNNISGQDYIVTWGQRGRIGETTIKPRVAFTATRVLPEFDTNSTLLTIPTPIALTEGNNWLENLSISPSPVASSKTIKKTKISPKQEQPNPVSYQYYQKPLPKH